MAAEGQRKIIIDKCNNLETWKAVKGYWDDKSGCGVVIEGGRQDQMGDNQ